MWKTILLFIALSPGMLLTLPPVGNKIVRSGKTCLAAAIVHGIIFAVLLRWLKIREAFQDDAAETGGPSIMMRKPAPPLVAKSSPVKMPTKSPIKTQSMPPPIPGGGVPPPPIVTMQPVTERYESARPNFNNMFPKPGCAKAEARRAELVNELDGHYSDVVNNANARDIWISNAKAAYIRLKQAEYELYEHTRSFEISDKDILMGNANIQREVSLRQGAFNNENNTLCAAPTTGSGVSGITVGSRVSCKGKIGTVAALYPPPNRLSVANIAFLEDHPISKKTFRMPITACSLVGPMVPISGLTCSSTKPCPAGQKCVSGICQGPAPIGPIVGGDGQIINNGNTVLCKGVFGSTSGIAEINGGKIDVIDFNKRITKGYNPSSCIRANMPVPPPFGGDPGAAVVTGTPDSQVATDANGNPINIGDNVVCYEKDKISGNKVPITGSVVEMLGDNGIGLKTPPGGRGTTGYGISASNCELMMQKSIKPGMVESKKMSGSFLDGVFPEARDGFYPYRR